MKGVIVLAAVLLAGCAQVKTLEELEFAAIKSGDWSAVDMREKTIERHKPGRAVRCRSDAIAICADSASGTDCRCGSRDVIKEWLYSR